VWHDYDSCPKCNGKNVKVEERDIPSVHSDDDIKRFLDGILLQADSYIISDTRCFVCNGKHTHYMIWPGRRDAKNYSVVVPLTKLPMCPIRVWHGVGKGVIKMPLNDFLKDLEVGKE